MKILKPIYRITELSSDQLDEAAGVYGEAFSDEPTDFSNVAVNFETTKNNPDYINLVALDLGSNAVVGYGLGILNRFCFDNGKPLLMIWGFCVHSAYRRQGLGALMMAEFENRARSQNCDSVWLFSDDSQTRIHEFYRQIGYKSDKMGFVKPLGE